MPGAVSATEIARAMDCTPEEVRLAPLHGGCIAEVYRVEAPGGRFVAKVGGGLGRLEARMLTALAQVEGLPVPRVIAAEPDLLILEWRPGRTGIRGAAGEHAAGCLARLHATPGPAFGWECDTVIGPLPQANPRTETFASFFCTSRLVPMARRAQEVGGLDNRTRARVERLGEDLSQQFDEPPAPVLVHGDLWSGNVLCDGDVLTAVLDPAVHWGHGEVDLAMATLFGGFDRRFYDAYHAATGSLDRDWWDRRRHLWNLWPLLVHAALFGSSYGRDVARALDKLGVR